MTIKEIRAEDRGHSFISLSLTGIGIKRNIKAKGYLDFSYLVNYNVTLELNKPRVSMGLVDPIPGVFQGLEGRGSKKGHLF